MKCCWNIVYDRTEHGIEIYRCPKCGYEKATFPEDMDNDGDE